MEKESSHSLMMSLTGQRLQDDLNLFVAIADLHY